MCAEINVFMCSQDCDVNEHLITHRPTIPWLTSAISDNWTITVVIALVSHGKYAKLKLILEKKEFPV